MLIPETLLLKTVQQGFAGLAQDASPLDDLFGSESALDRSRLQAILADRQRKPVIQLGFPQGPIQVPTIGLTLGGGTEDEALQPIGMGQRSMAGQIGGQPYVQTQSTTFFQHNLRFTVYATNETLAVYLSYIVLYLLLSARDFLTEQGLYEQTVAMSDFLPSPDFLPDLAYVRAVMFSAQSESQFGTNLPFVPVTHFNVSLLETE